MLSFLLLSQIIGTGVWQTQVKSLREVYYIGFTFQRLLIRAYNCIRDPVFNHYLPTAEHRSSVFFSKSEDVMIMTTMVILAITVRGSSSDSSAFSFGCLHIKPVVLHSEGGKSHSFHIINHAWRSSSLFATGSAIHFRWKEFENPIKYSYARKNHVVPST